MRRRSLLARSLALLTVPFPFLARLVRADVQEPAWNWAHAFMVKGALVHIAEGDLVHGIPTLEHEGQTFTTYVLTRVPGLLHAHTLSSLYMLQRMEFIGKAGLREGLHWTGGFWTTVRDYTSYRDAVLDLESLSKGPTS